MARLSDACNQNSALTWGALKRLWAGLPDDAAVLVAQSPEVADWAQAADALDTDTGLVARLHAPPAKLGWPAPGTIWNPAPVIEPNVELG
jgi:hypothetical protein